MSKDFFAAVAGFFFLSCSGELIPFYPDRTVICVNRHKCFFLLNLLAVWMHLAMEKMINFFDLQMKNISRVGLVINEISACIVVGHIFDFIFDEASLSTSISSVRQEHSPLLGYHLSITLMYIKKTANSYIYTNIWDRQGSDSYNFLFRQIFSVSIAVFGDKIRCFTFYCLHLTSVWLKKLVERVGNEMQP